MNKAVDVPALTKMMAEFEKENAKTEIMQEIMGDTLDDALADENTEEEEEQIVNQVLDEIGKLDFAKFRRINLPLFLIIVALLSRRFVRSRAARGFFGVTSSQGVSRHRESGRSGRSRGSRFE